MVCDLFVFLNIKNNPKVSCVFHAARPSSGFSLGFGGWGLLWGLWRRDLVINDGIGKVCRWDSYAETAAFSTCLFYCLTKHGDRYVRFVGICFGGLLGFLVCFFLSLCITPSFWSHSLGTSRGLPFTAVLLLDSCCVSLLRCFLSQSLM